jgi:hypothetical protein
VNTAVARVDTRRSFCLGPDMLRNFRKRRHRGEIPMWRLSGPDKRTIDCTLQQRGDTGCSLAVVLDGGEIAAQHYLTTTDAVSRAGFLLERLTASGWTLISDMPHIALH